jgi:V/A-type H+-transporting ATPase subunit I
MIVKMKKVTVLCSASAVDATLERLREVGVLHLAHVRTPEGESLEKARRQLVHMKRALDVLPRAAAAKPSGRPAAAVIEDVWNLIQERKGLDEELASLTRERIRVEAFGDFDSADLHALRGKGVFVKLYQVSSGEAPVAPPGAAVIELAGAPGAGCYAIVSGQDFRAEAPEFRLPELAPARLRERIADLEGRMAENDRLLAACAGDRPVVAAQVYDMEDQVRFLEARAGLGHAEQVAYVRGYCPESLLDMVSGEAAGQGWAVLARDPEAGEPVPTLIRNPRWVRPIKVVFDMIGILPGYEEIDISAVFLVFFSVFFAMLVGDAGYGALFLGLTWWARRKWPRAPAQPFALVTIMGGCTILWGVMTGTYFGLSNIPAPLQGLKIGWLGNNEHMMLLCFTLGALHLTVAHLWNAWRVLNTPRALGQVGWICTTWTMYFLARMMVLGHPLPGFVIPMFTTGVALIVLFMTPVRALKTEWFNHVMLPLSLVSNFVDVVSYLRLFAVGVAGFAVANAFNAMAMAGVRGVGTGMAAALILFFGHALNILLSAMGVLVHGVRLNTLEFSSHVGMQWSGLTYRPFQRTREMQLLNQ